MPKKEVSKNDKKEKKEKENDNEYFGSEKFNKIRRVS